MLLWRSSFLVFPFHPLISCICKFSSASYGKDIKASCFDLLNSCSKERPRICSVNVGKCSSSLFSFFMGRTRYLNIGS